ncbi:hypothetical protein EV356DRAFT_158816 [Viridothelium virens]|uniref:Uncharacterized protein n=1 Tax=Viridothelium virens TaxID=1048519 RepID=A0A6A6H8N0_VIRVR|nr:hypothetical protein EV356DRAFT_158816 [Viridothelium virens]
MSTPPQVSHKTQVTRSYTAPPAAPALIQKFCRYTSCTPHTASRMCASSSPSAVPTNDGIGLRRLCCAGPDGLTITTPSGFQRTSNCDGSSPYWYITPVDFWTPIRASGMQARWEKGEADQLVGRHLGVQDGGDIGSEEVSGGDFEGRRHIRAGCVPRQRWP